MKFLSLLLSFLLLAVQPAQAVVMVGFGQSAVAGGPIAFPVAVTIDSPTSTSDTEVSVAVPTDTASGDCIIFLGKSDTRTTSPPSGVTELAHSNVSGNAYVWYKKAGGSETSYTFTASGTFSNISVMALRITGAVCESTSDFTVATSGYASSANVVICPNITTPEATMAVLWMSAGTNDKTSTSNNRGGATERGDFSGDTYGSHLSIWSEPIDTAEAQTGAQISLSGYTIYESFSVAIKTAQ